MAFWLGCAAVIADVLAHLPMLAMAAPMHFRLAGKPMGSILLVRMALVPLDVLLVAYGLMPRLPQMLRTLHADRSPPPFLAAHEEPLNGEHWKRVIVLRMALAVDVMKPATIGAAIGSVVWGRLGNLFGRRASLLCPH